MNNHIDLKLLAVTRMLNEICVAGVDENNNWKRPVRPTNLNLLKGDIFQNNICVIKNYNIVRFLSMRNLNNIPHSEDFIVDWSYSPTVIGRLDHDAQKELFQNIDETNNIDDNISSYLIRNNRSLMLIKPERITHCSWINTYNDKYKPQIQFVFKGNPYRFSCTDLKWRAYGREILNRTRNMIDLNNIDLYFVIGLTRIFRETYWPMVIGLHTIPNIEVEIDYNNL